MSEYVIDNRYRCSLYHATCVTVCNSLLFITAHQREGNVFIQVCLSTGGSNMTIIQDALDPPSPVPSTRYGTFLDRDTPASRHGPHWTGTPLLVTYGGHHWRPVQTCSLQDCSPTSAFIWWPLKYVRSAQAGGTHPTVMLSCSIQSPQHTF